MSPRARFFQLLRKTVFVAVGGFSLTCLTLLPTQKLLGQENAPKYLTIATKLKEESEIKVKRKAKDVARAAKTGNDVAPIKIFYQEYLVPRLTVQNPEVINETRVEILADMSGVSANRELQKAYNSLLLQFAQNLITKKEYSPSTRINAAVLVGRMNSVVTRSSVVPEPSVQALLINLVDSSGLEGLSSSAMSSLLRHLSTAPENMMSEANRRLLLTKLKAFMEAPKPPARSQAAADYLKGQMLECLTLLSKIEPDKDISKEATAFLTPVLVKLLSENTSEWLLETACLSFGSIKPVNLTPEDLAKLEVGIAKFARASMTSWKKRILMSTSSGGVTGGLGSGGMGPGMGMGPGSAAGGGEDGEGGLMGGGGSGNRAGSGSQARPARQEKPKELINARRIAHQRFERIHFALNGVFIAAKKEPSVVKPTIPSGLLPLLTDEAKKEKLKSLIEKIEAFQSDLNEEKVVDLSSLVTAVGKSSKELRLICIDISGEKKPEEVVAEDSSDPFSK